MADIAEFIRQIEECGVPLADEWWEAEAGATQPVGLACPVPSCGVVVGRANLLRRHWMANHERKIVIFLCPIEGCGWRSKRADKVKEHGRKCHDEAFLDEEDRKRKLRFLPWIEEDNGEFVDPGETCAPKGILQIRPTLNPGERFPPRRLTEATERRGRKRGMEEDGEKTRAKLLEELGEAQKQVREWNERIVVLKKELKKREIEKEREVHKRLKMEQEESRKLRQKIKELEAEK
jgi:hypothetical protein